jgi:hypothetical protein
MGGGQAVTGVGGGVHFVGGWLKVYGSCRGNVTPLSYARGSVKSGDLAAEGAITNRV